MKFLKNKKTAEPKQEMRKEVKSRLLSGEELEQEQIRRYAIPVEMDNKDVSREEGDISMCANEDGYHWIIQKGHKVWLKGNVMYNLVNSEYIEIGRLPVHHWWIVQKGIDLLNQFTKKSPDPVKMKKRIVFANREPKWEGPIHKLPPSMRNQF